MPTDTLLFPVPPRQPRRRRAHRYQAPTITLPAVYLPAAVPVLQRPPLAGLRYHAGLGSRVTAGMLADRGPS